MTIIKLLAKIAIITALVATLFALFTFNRCLPDGCAYGDAVCSDNDCLTESVSQHIGERMLFLFSGTKTGSTPILLTLLSVLFLVSYSIECTYVKKSDPITLRERVKNKGNFFNILIPLFSDGILNPKIH